MSNDKKPRLLILDDERLVRFTNGVYFRQNGFDVVECATPEEAIGVISARGVDLVISDVNMGTVDGFMFRAMVRRIDETIPIIFLTSMVNDDNNLFLMKLMEDIHSYYVSKSSPRDYFVSKVKQVLKAYRAQKDVEQSKVELEKSLRLASCVQRSMLPHWSRVSKVYGYSTAIHSYDAVSGDLIEWYRPTEDTSLVILGDVSGHGTNAALAMTAIQAFLKQFKHIETGLARRIHHIANLIQEFISKNLRDVAYMAATIIFVDFAGKRVRYLNCGNPEPYIAHLGDGTRRIVNPDKKGALPIGLFHDTKYTEDDIVEFDFVSGDVYVQHSDGVSDVSSDPEGKDTIPADILSEVYRMTIRDQPEEALNFCELPYRILGAIEDIGYSHMQDDMSILSFTPFAKPDGSIFMHRVRMHPGKIDAVCNTCGLWVADRFKSEELGVKTELLLNEHLMNIFRHGYDAFAKQREVCIIVIREHAGHMEIAVWDRGAPWNEIGSSSEEEADRKLDQQNDTLAGGGRGQAIMRKICDSITRDRVSILNRTVFRIKLPESYTKGKEE